MIDKSAFYNIAKEKGVLESQKPDHLRTLPSPGSTAYNRMSDEQKAAVKAERRRRTNARNWAEANRGSDKKNPYVTTDVEWSSGFEGGYDFEQVEGYNPDFYRQQRERFGLGGSGYGEPDGVASAQGGGSRGFQRDGGMMSTQPVGEPMPIRGQPVMGDMPARGGGGGDIYMDPYQPTDGVGDIDSPPDYGYQSTDLGQIQNQNFLQLLQALGLENLFQSFQPYVAGQAPTMYTPPTMGGAMPTGGTGLFGLPQNFGTAPLNIGYLPPLITNPNSAVASTGMLNQVY